MDPCAAVDQLIKLSTATTSLKRNESYARVQKMPSHLGRRRRRCCCHRRRCRCGSCCGCDCRVVIVVAIVVAVVAVVIMVVFFQTICFSIPEKNDFE